MPIERVRNAITDPTTTLNGAIDASTTTVVVASAAALPSSGNFRILVESEIMRVSGVSGNTLTVVRGYEGTTGASHASGVAVNLIVTAEQMTHLGPVLLDEADLTGTSVTLSNIDQTYRAVELRGVVRSNKTMPDISSPDLLNLRLNGDTGNNYDYGNHYTFTGTQGIGGSNEVSFAFVAEAGGSLQTANAVSMFIINIPNYAQTTFWKSGMNQSTSPRDMANMVSFRTGWWWRSTSAVTSITLYLTSGSYITGSKVALYGLP